MYNITPTPPTPPFLITRSEMLNLSPFSVHVENRVREPGGAYLLPQNWSAQQKILTGPT